MHEMTKNDSAVYFKNPAWHGLGNVIEESMSIPIALEESGLDWRVYKSNIYAEGIMSQEHHAIIRNDIDEIIGVVGNRYKIVQNQEVFNLAEHFGDSVTVESAGSIQNGRKAYLLLRGESFNASPNDVVSRYMALFWSHDGTQSLTVLPTSIRVVCKNTLDMVIGESRNTNNKISLSHAGNMEEKIKQAEFVISKFNETGNLFQGTVNSLVHTSPSVRDVTQFFMESFQMLNNVKIQVNPTTEADENNKLRALTTISGWQQTMEEESQDGVNYWVAANAITNSIQHSVGTRGRKKTPASSAYSNLIGKNAADSKRVFRSALNLV